MTEMIGVYGAGGCGRGVMPLVRAQVAGREVRLVFIDDAPSAAVVNGHAVVTWKAFLADPAGRKSAILAVAQSMVREKLALRCVQAEIGLRQVRAETVVIMDDVSIAEGAVLSPFVTLTSNIRIGRCFQANLYSYVEHDCVIGDFVTFAPGVKCNGNVVIEDHAYIGTGAILRQGQPGSPLVIGRGAVVGMGAVVTKNVAAGVTVVGNPARPLVKD